MNRLNTTLAALLTTLPLAACATPPAALKPFPQAEAGQVRHVIALPARDNEADQRVELIVGKTLEVDCNTRWLGGELQEKTVQGWGYSYYQLDQLGPAASTLMACPDDSRRQAFVPLRGEPLLLRYNSQLPLVVYTPADVEVRYRIWSAAPDSEAAVPQ
ncbi:serine protease inhibitor ecotin [Pseudomonas xionganensis]|uniref:Serine protease inhibitor ecotin n=1 Tax=Pseudomonas xionganensis TaxID=2654845 RepID=A0A6I4KT29_9PSED|nr:serine protease inhibitor ecotin [Pseudomonas xionganensis]MVW75224.1 serine protease inhibitor ecotin [Pseudomonas xionganensis]